MAAEHGVCRRCGGEMVEGVALRNTPRPGIPDFPGDEPDELNRGQTYSNDGPAKMLNVRKCSKCGYSIPPFNPKELPND